MVTGWQLTQRQKCWQSHFSECSLLHWVHSATWQSGNWNSAFTCAFALWYLHKYFAQKDLQTSQPFRSSWPTCLNKLTSLMIVQSPLMHAAGRRTTFVSVPRLKSIDCWTVLSLCSSKSTTCKTQSHKSASVLSHIWDDQCAQWHCIHPLSACVHTPTFWWRELSESWISWCHRLASEINLHIIFQQVSTYSTDLVEHDNGRLVSWTLSNKSPADCMGEILLAFFSKVPPHTKDILICPCHSVPVSGSQGVWAYCEDAKWRE